MCTVTERTAKGVLQNGDNERTLFRFRFHSTPEARSGRCDRSPQAPNEIADRKKQLLYRKVEGFINAMRKNPQRLNVTRKISYSVASTVAPTVSPAWYNPEAFLLDSWKVNFRERADFLIIGRLLNRLWTTDQPYPRTGKCVTQKRTTSADITRPFIQIHDDRTFRLTHKWRANLGDLCYEASTE